MAAYLSSIHVVERYCREDAFLTACARNSHFPAPSPAPPTGSS